MRNYFIDCLGFIYVLFVLEIFGLNSFICCKKLGYICWARFFDPKTELNVVHQILTPAFFSLFLALLILPLFQILHEIKKVFVKAGFQELVRSH